MKSFKLLLSFIVLAAVAAAPLLRADSSSPAQLTPAQTAKISALHKEESKELKELRADSKTKEADKKAKAKSIKEDFDAKIAAVKAGT